MSGLLAGIVVATIIILLVWLVVVVLLQAQQDLACWLFHKEGSLILKLILFPVWLVLTLFKVGCWAVALVVAIFLVCDIKARLRRR